MRLALGDPEFVEGMLAAARSLERGMLEGDVEALEDWARVVGVLRESINGLENQN